MSEPDPTTCPVPPIEGKRLGKRPAISDPRLLNFARFVDLAKVPASYNPWKKRAPFPARTYGNRTYGCCTRASQANHATRFERVESKRTIRITDDEVVRVYFDLTWREYGDGKNGTAEPPGWRDPNGPGDVGAYELDALSAWRKPEETFRDDKGHALTIDAFTGVNHRNIDEVKAAICLSGKFGMKLCLNLPVAFQRIDPPTPWDVPAGQQLIGEWEPNSWGGHSLYVDSYDATGVRLVHTWWEGDGAVDEQTLTWRALATYGSEAFWIIDSVDAWRKRTPAKLAAGVDLAGIVKAVNKVSATKVEA